MLPMRQLLGGATRPSECRGHGTASCSADALLAAISIAKSDNHGQLRARSCRPAHTSHPEADTPPAPVDGSSTEWVIAPLSSPILGHLPILTRCRVLDG